MSWKSVACSGQRSDPACVAAGTAMQMADLQHKELAAEGLICPAGILLLIADEQSSKRSSPIVAGKYGTNLKRLVWTSTTQRWAEHVHQDGRSRCWSALPAAAHLLPSPCVFPYILSGMRCCWLFAAPTNVIANAEQKQPIRLAGGSVIGHLFAPHAEQVRASKQPQLHSLARQRVWNQ